MYGKPTMISFTASRVAINDNEELYIGIHDKYIVHRLRKLTNSYLSSNGIVRWARNVRCSVERRPKNLNPGASAPKKATLSSTQFQPTKHVDFPTLAINNSNFFYWKLYCCPTYPGCFSGCYRKEFVDIVFIVNSCKGKSGILIAINIKYTRI